MNLRTQRDAAPGVRDGAARRRKGVQGEREVAAIFAAAGFEVRGLEGKGDHLCIVVRAEGGIGGVGAGARGLDLRPVTLHSEAKRQERLRIPEWWAQTLADCPDGAIPVLSFRQSRSEWLSLIRTEQLVALIAAGWLR